MQKSPKNGPWLNLGLKYLVENLQDDKVGGPANTMRRLINARWEDFEVGVFSKRFETEEQRALYYKNLINMADLLKRILALKNESLIKDVVHVLEQGEKTPLNFEDFRAQVVPLVKSAKRKNGVKCFFCCANELDKEYGSLLKEYDKTFPFASRSMGVFR